MRRDVVCTQGRGARPVAALFMLALMVVSCAGGGGAGQGRSVSHATSRSAASGEQVGRGLLPPCPVSARRPAVEGGLPRLTLECLGSGPAVTLSGLRGRPLVVNVWASWCPPCAREMPILDRARRQVGDRVRFVGVDLLDTRSAALDAARAFGMGFPSVFDPDGEARAALDVPGPPVTLFVSADGTVVHRHIGEVRSDAQLRDLMASHLGVIR